MRLSTNILITGGDVIGLIRRQVNHRFQEMDAMFISACVIEAFKYLHKYEIIYRDLKPENVFLTPNGYFKLGDFGLVKKMSGESKTFSFIGTEEYMAPEIILSRGHNRAVDYWTLGIFIYEMLSGKTPFADKRKTRIFTNILEGIDKVMFPSYFSYNSQHLVKKLCRPLSSERLGMSRKGMSDVKSHAWFNHFNWQEFINRKMYTPFKFEPKSAIDTAKIDKFPTLSIEALEETSDWDSSF